VIPAVGVLTLAAVAVLIWLSVGRDVLRVGYVKVTEKPSRDGDGRPPTPTPLYRHEGVLHLAIVDHVDPGLVLVVLRLDDGGQWISTVRVDQQGFGTSRLDEWRTDARRVVVNEKPRGHEVIFRPLKDPKSQPLYRRLARVAHSEPTVELAKERDGAPRGVDDVGRQGSPIPRLRLIFAFAVGVISIISSLVLMCTDGVDAGVSWTHHAGISAAPLLLVAGALLAISMALPPTGKAALLRIVTITAFTTWGLSQLLPNTGAGTLLDDFAILLFVIDAGVFAMSDSMGLLRKRDLVGPETKGEPSDGLNLTETERAA